jgi:hypothetical protein
MLTMITVIGLMCVGQAQRYQPTDAEMRALLAAGARQAHEKEPDIVADAGTVGRIAAQEPSFQFGELEKLYANVANTSYIANFKMLTLREATLRFHSGAFVGFLRQGHGEAEVRLYKSPKEGTCFTDVIGLQITADGRKHWINPEGDGFDFFNGKAEEYEQRGPEDFSFCMTMW